MRRRRLGGDVVRRTGTVTRDGVKLVYDEFGDGEITVVLLHGMACSRSHMYPLAEHLGGRYHCVVLDQRGHGDSDKPPTGYTMAEFHADLDALFEELHLDRPILVGHSFGGSISLAYAHAHPDRIRALVMLDSGMRTNQTINADLGPFYRQLREGDYAATLDGFVRARLVDPVDGEAFAARIAAEMATVPVHVFLAMSESVQELRSMETAVEFETVPALHIASCQHFVDEIAAEQLPPNWQRGRVVGAGHFIQLVAPEQVHPMVDRFFELVLG